MGSSRQLLASGFLIIMISASGLADEPCLTAPELKKTYEFLSDQEDLSFDLKKKITISSDVSKGCSGAFERFAKSYLLLKKSGSDLSHALKVGMIFAQGSQEKFENFYNFFQEIYLQDAFDFDFKSAFDLAMSLSSDFKGNAKRAGIDFRRSTQFCQSKKGLDLPIKSCADISTKIVLAGLYFPDGGFPDFEKTYLFLRSDQRIHYSMTEALSMALQVLKYGAEASTNLIQSFDFFYSAKLGPGMNAASALKLAMEQSKLTVRGSGPQTYE